MNICAANFRFRNRQQQKTLERVIEPTLNTNDSKSSNTTAQVVSSLFDAKKFSDISKIINSYNEVTPFQIVHVGIFSLDNILIRDVIHSCAFEGLRVEVNDFAEELKWGVCLESEHLLSPFDLLTHKFETVDTHLYDDLRKVAERAGLKQIMIIPMKVKNTTSVVIINFPLADYKDHANELLPQLYQIMIAIYAVFPKLLAWPEIGALTLREAEILSLSAIGLTEPEIAERCGISINTVRNHVENSKKKLNARNKLHAVMIAAEINEIEQILRLEPKGP